MSTTIIIVVFFAIVHILSAIAKEAAKRKERQRKQEIEAQRRAASGHMSAQPVAESRSIDSMFGPGAATSPEPAPIRRDTKTGKPLDELVTRRQQQLQQLRNRREAARMSSPTMRVTSAPPLTASRSAPIPVKRGPTPEQLRARQQERQRQEQQEAKAKRTREVELARQRQAEVKKRLQEARRLEAPEAAPRSVSSALESGDALRDADAKSAVRRRKLIAGLKDQNSLRELFVLKELIDRPLALRQSES